jgi:hypothetical protein
MKLDYSSIFDINRMIKDAFNQQKKEVLNAKKEVDEFCKKSGYAPSKSCSNCYTIFPESFHKLVEKGNYGELFNLKNSPVKLRKKLKKTFKKASISGVVCFSYCKPRFLRRGEEGVIFVQEFSTKIAASHLINQLTKSKIPSKQKSLKSLSQFLLSQSQKQTTEQPSISYANFSLGTSKYYCFGVTSGNDIETTFSEKCRKELGIAGDIPIRFMDLAYEKMNSKAVDSNLY